MGENKRNNSSWRHGVRDGFDRTGNVICEGCFEKKLRLEELKEENNKLRKRKMDFDVLTKELRETKKELRRLQGILERQQPPKASGGAHVPSSRIAFKKGASADNVARRGGAKLGHRGFGRKRVLREEAEQVIDIPAPALCPDCSEELKVKEYRERTALEAQLTPVQKTVYRFELKKCPQCRKVLQGQAPLAPRALYGDGLLAKMLTMHFVHGITIGKVCKMLGCDIKPSGVINAFHRVATLFEPALEDLKLIYRNSGVKHADETGWRIDGQSGWAWLFCNQNISIFRHAQSRSQKTVREIIGLEQLPGVLVVDRYNGYNRAPCQIQYCYAHLLRDVKQLKKEFPDDEEVHEFVQQLSALLTGAMKLAERERNSSNRNFLALAKEIKEQIIQLVASPAKHLGITDIQNIFHKHKRRLYHWSTSRDVPAHNNFAEREIRQIVIARKVSFGSQSELGAHSRSVLASVLHTAQKNISSNFENWLAQTLSTIQKNHLTSISALIPFSPDCLVPDH